MRKLAKIIKEPIDSNKERKLNLRYLGLFKRSILLLENTGMNWIKCIKGYSNIYFVI